MLDNLLMLQYQICNLFLKKDAKHHVEHIEKADKQ